MKLTTSLLNNMNYLTPFFSLLLLPILPFMSIYIMLFSKIFVALQVALFLIWRTLKGRFKDIYYWIICLSSILLWITVFFSRRSIPMSADMTACSEAGWPLQIFTYPCGAMGGDYVPLAMWKPFYLSYFIWMAVSVLLVGLLAKYKFLKSQKIKRWLLVVYILINSAGLGLLLLAFD